MADQSSPASEHQSTEVDKTLLSSNELLKPLMKGNDGHIANSPEESLSPASVIYFKEALTYNSSIQFSKTSSSASPVRYDFQIEKTKKTRMWRCEIHCGAVSDVVTCLHERHVWHYKEIHLQ
ncbi:hypothetical protein E1301_Tti012199 [Triplophysa tibetana]|uniref:Uncharacterized protein n=1 Tax=Triplophysa tibetana TaxID=1572043 RepID=A0A5A9P9L6_9TELE|nr:hypothetical protein E1301_Tti012199 [Triplophysa tibetana]